MSSFTLTAAESVSVITEVLPWLEPLVRLSAAGANRLFGRRRAGGADVDLARIAVDQRSERLDLGTAQRGDDAVHQAEVEAADEVGVHFGQLAERAVGE